MPDESLNKVVERVVARVLENHVPRLREELVSAVLQDVRASGGGGPQTTSADLLRAVSVIHTGATQREILRALLDSAAQYCTRVALFVVKSGAATGWQGRGFDDGDGLKDFPFDLNSGLGSRVLQDRTPALGKASDVDPRFIERFRAPAQNQAMLLPLMLKEKLAALVYADGSMDAVALELLTLATSAWLEVAALRKQSPKEGESTTPGARVQTPVPVETVSTFNDPFAAHAPRHAVASIPAAPAAASERHTDPDATIIRPAASVATAPDGLSPEDADTHRKAQRFAKLLVDEIKLYNQAKVTEGRKHKDLYDRLKEEIDKSRATYQRRYGNTTAASGDYFNGEVVRSLAEDDPSIMGANFRR
jgi:hypothetical protein